MASLTSLIVLLWSALALIGFALNSVEQKMYNNPYVSDLAQAVEANKYDYDSWYQYIRVMESEGLENAEQIIELYERAIANKPPSQASYFFECMKSWPYDNVVLRLEKTEESRAPCTDYTSNLRYHNHIPS